jgi:protoporphyrinogen oxidase
MPTHLLTGRLFQGGSSQLMNLPGNRRPRVCIIGAGLTGLVAAWRLLSAGCDVVILESTLEPGGMLASFPMGTDRIEYIYHHAFTHDVHLLDLIRELGLDNLIGWYQPRNALYAGSRLYPFTTPLDLLRFRLIPPLQRIKTGLAVLKASRLRDWPALEKQTAAQWLQKNSGQTAYTSLWRPLLRAKFDQDASEVSAVWIWNKFKLRGHSRDRKLGHERLGYLHGSFGALAGALVKAIRAGGGDMRTGHTAMNIGRTTAQRLPGDSLHAGAVSYRVSCILENCATVDIEADAVIATISGRQFSSITTNLNLDAYRKKAVAVRNKGNLCLILRLKNSLSPYYWTTVCDDLPFIVVVEHTNLTGPDPYGGHVVYLSRYLDVTDSLWTQSDGEIYRLFVKGLDRMYDHFRSSDIIDWRLRRTRYAQPVIDRHYSRHMPALDTPDPGIKLAGMAQIYPEDRGMSYAVRLGLDAATAVGNYLTHCAAADSAPPVAEEDTAR